MREADRTAHSVPESPRQCGPTGAFRVQSGQWFCWTFPKVVRPPAYTGTGGVRDRVRHSAGTRNDQHRCPRKRVRGSVQVSCGNRREMAGTLKPCDRTSRIHERRTATSRRGVSSSGRKNSRLLPLAARGAASASRAGSRANALAVWAEGYGANASGTRHISGPGCAEALRLTSGYGPTR